MARPTKFNDKLAKTILKRLQEGESLHSICRDGDMPNRSSVHLWLANDSSFSDQYAHAKALAAEKRAEEIIEIADEAQHAESSVAVQAAKLRIDARQWYTKVTAPKKYGTDHVEATNKNLNAEVSKQELIDFNEVLNGSC